MRPLLNKIGTRWALIALAAAVIAFVAGVSYGLRTDGGILARWVTSTPTSIYDLNTPTAWELNIAYATAVSQTPTAVVVVTGGSASKPAAAMSKEEKEKAALRAAYRAAEDTFDGGTHYWDERITKITFNLEEYLGIHPKQAIYLVDIDRVIRLPKNIKYVQSFDKWQSPPATCIRPSWWSGKCPVFPTYNLMAPSGNKVWVDSAGYVFVPDSDTLPEGFSFLSDLKVWRYSSDRYR